MDLLLQLEFLATIFFCAFVCLGWGALGLKFFPSFRGFSLGVIGALGILQIGLLSMSANWFFPLNGIFAGVLFAGAAWGWIDSLKSKRMRFDRFSWSVAAITMILYWILGMRRVLHSDTGLYHLPLIQWMQTSALPIGLANLHSRFSFWNFWFSVCGGINAGNVIPLSVFSMNIVLVGFAAVDFVRWITGSVLKIRYFSLALLLFIAFLDTWYFGGGQKSPNADFAGGICGIWAFGYFLQKGEDDEWIAPVILLSGLAILMKLNQAVWGLLILQAMYVSWKKSGRLPKISLILICIGGLLSVMKGFWTSGCLVFPVASSCFSVPWGVGVAEAEDTYSWIVRWARWAGGPKEETLHTWQWFPMWWDGHQKMKLIICVEWAASIFIVAKLFLKKKLPSLDWTALSIAFIGVAYWFLTAPDIRFGFGYILTVFCLLATPLLQWIFSLKKGQLAEKWVVRLALITLLLSSVGQVRRADDFGANTLREPVSEFELKRNVAGQEVLVPKENECWRLPVPCTPYFDEKVIWSEKGIWTSFQKQR